MTARILIVEDENELATIIADYAKAAGYDAEVIGNGRTALAAIERQTPDLIVLDLQLPGLDGLSVCKTVRRFSDVPIIMVTARVEEVDRLIGLEIGADDYVCKPFSPRELVARIKVILRRRRPDEPERLLVIDESTHTIRLASQPLTLTASEYVLLATMAKRRGTIYSRAQLLDLVRHDNFDVGDRAIDTHIKNLRRKLSAVLPDVEIIHSVYGLGYRVEF